MLLCAWEETALVSFLLFKGFTSSLRPIRSRLIENCLLEDKFNFFLYKLFLFFPLRVGFFYAHAHGVPNGDCKCCLVYLYGQRDPRVSIDLSPYKGL